LKKGKRLSESARRWVVVNIHLPAEFEDAVANFMTEHGSVGIEEREGERGWRELRVYFAQDGRENRVLSSLHRYLDSMRRLFPGRFNVNLQTHVIPDEDWGESWKRFFKPIRVTSRVVVKAPWHRVRLKQGEQVIEITPGLAFGTGTHATTKLCVRALKRRLHPRGMSVLDVGTGSGILAIVAAKLGAREVWGCDSDGLSVEMARENVERNRVSGVVRIRKGTIGVIRRTFDVAVANIDRKVLRKMRWPLIHHLNPHGWLILSGILARESEGLSGHYQETGAVRLMEMRREDEWVCLSFQKAMR
jgi:ribosomal protein L11 methyltransferase